MTATPNAIEQTQRRVLSAADVRAECIRLGFDLVGFTDVRASGHAAFLRAWLAAGRHAGMSYLSRPDAVVRRVRPDVAYPELRTAIVLGISYFADEADGLPATGDAVAHGGDPSRAVIARYARGRDYHKVIRKKLITLLRWIEDCADTTLPLARAYVDTGPVLERELAQRAGLGWFGRSTMIVNPTHGSYFFLATLLIELELDELDAPFERDHCGTCNACVEACPTGALLGRDGNGAPVIDATRCISYLTIENRGAIPRELRPLIGNRIFGCDICQEVCPWNGPKFVQLTRERDFSARDHALNRKLVELMRMSPAEWDDFSRGSAIRRAGRAGFMRNVAVGLGNSGSHEAVSALAAALSDPEPLVRGHVVWALSEIATAEALAAIAELASSEADPFVLGEVEAAFSSDRANVK